MDVKRIIVMWMICMVIGCATVPITGRKQLSFLSPVELLSVSEDNYRSILRQVTLSKDPHKIALVEKVGRKIALAAESFMRDHGREDEVYIFQWEFSVIEDDEMINAFALPRGKIFVYTGMFPVAQDEGGMAAVISHEVAHVLANHGGERMSQLLLIQLGGISLSKAASDEPEKVQRLLNMAYGLGTTFGVMLPYSRLQEMEADHIGLVLMAEAGYDPLSALLFWERMKQVDPNRLPAFISTHPDPDQRIANIKQELQKLRKYDYQRNNYH